MWVWRRPWPRTFLWSTLVAEWRCRLGTLWVFGGGVGRGRKEGAALHWSLPPHFQVLTGYVLVARPQQCLVWARRTAPGASNPGRLLAPDGSFTLVAPLGAPHPSPATTPESRADVFPHLLSHLQQQMALLMPLHPVSSPEGCVW